MPKKNIVEKWVNFFIYKKRIRSTENNEEIMNISIVSAKYVAGAIKS